MIETVEIAPTIVADELARDILNYLKVVPEKERTEQHLRHYILNFLRSNTAGHVVPLQRR